jgi:16S rRNA (cytidine1402-2'-O)-methyltransferase
VSAPGTLHVVGTPIGNLGDLTARAVDVLRRCDRVVAEDTRRTRAMLSHLAIAGKPLDCVDEHASPRDLDRVVAHLVAGESVALVTDAGAPAVSDPGTALVRAAIAAGVPVVPVPGPSAVTAAISVAGFGGAGFYFAGFVPRAGTARRDALARIAATPEPVVLFESPNRTADTLADLAALAPARPAMVARELTKLHEELVRGSLAELAARGAEWIGEVTIVLGPDEAAGRPADVDDAAVDARIDEELAKGVHAKDAADRVAAWSGRPRREVYARVIARRPR